MEMSFKLYMKKWHAKQNTIIIWFLLKKFMEKSNNLNGWVLILRFWFQVPKVEQGKIQYLKVEYIYTYMFAFFLTLYIVWFEIQGFN